MPRNLLDITHLEKMNSARRILILLCLLPILCLGGCSSINSNLAAGMADGIPQWAGGLPADAPPRPGTAEYHEMIKERERERLMPKTDDSAAESSNHKAKGAVH
jgi:hypothetical protein